MGNLSGVRGANEVLLGRGVNGATTGGIWPIRGVDSATIESVETDKMARGRLAILERRGGTTCGCGAKSLTIRKSA